MNPELCRTKAADSLLLFATSFAVLLISGGPIRGDTTLPTSFAYVLQADALAKTKSAAVEKLITCGRDWIVLDAVFSGDERWTSADLAAIRAGCAGRKVMAYLSIGE